MLSCDLACFRLSTSHSFFPLPVVAISICGKKKSELLEYACDWTYGMEGVLCFAMLLDSSVSRGECQYVKLQEE